MKKVKFVYIISALLGMFLFAPAHLGYSTGDHFFEWLGVPAWIETGGSGRLHLTAIIGLLLLVTGIIGIGSMYESVYPKIRSRVILGCIAVLFIFPYVTEYTMYVFKFNASGISSVDYSFRDSKCDYHYGEQKAKARCSLRIYNYGKAQEVHIRPIDDLDDTNIVYEYKTLDLPRRSNQLYTNLVFEGQLAEDISGSGWSSKAGVEIVADGSAQQYRDITYK
ncbi:hypothetical protein [Paenibacillus lemnae]|uniref:Uncharacterized protein n=1 Tax=Paenibacillus lemnae TaxID=1330551 RepID=A0A848MCM1_PAELE|nr:hypothetical protein [Paenibacillus lemnae]NMO97184.1 hypothetical protein [Paenibacillus lemnae]